MADSYNVNDITQLNGVKKMAQRISARLSALEAKQDTTALHAVAVNGNTVNFYTTTDTTTAAAYSFDFPEEIFLDQAGTTLVENFTWSAITYPDSTNPNLEGKTVLVLAVKGDATPPTTKYSFVDMAKLMNAYTSSDTSLTINNYAVKVNISAATGNMLSLNADGLMVDGSGKMDKVIGATAGNIAIFASDGSIVDSTLKVAIDAEFTAMLDEVLPVSGS